MFMNKGRTEAIKIICTIAIQKAAHTNVVTYIVFIHSNLISCSLIGSSVNTRSVLKMSTTLRVLRPDCERCFWCAIARVIVTSTDPFFLLGEVVNLLHV